MRNHIRGLTLLEMMIVLIIAGMAIALGFQSLGQWQRAEESLARVGSGAREAGLTEAWWRDSVRGITAQSEAKLTGSASEFSATTTSALLASPGATTGVRWSLLTDRDGTRLALAEDGKTIGLTLPDATQARFMYLDADGELQAEWPPQLGIQSTLPIGIALIHAGSDGRQRVWMAALSGPPQPYYQAFELEGD